MRLFSILTLSACLFTIACGSESFEETVNRKVSESILEASGSSVDINQLKDVIDEVSKSVGDSSIAVEIMDFRTLKELLPETAAGLDKTDHRGEKSGAMGFVYSQSTAKYGGNDENIKITLADLGGTRGLLMAMAQFAVIEIDKESSDGFERTIDLDGNPAYESQSNTRGTTSSLKVLIKNRFVLTIDGKNKTAEELRAVYEEIDTAQLPDLPKANQ